MMSDIEVRIGQTWKIKSGNEHIRVKSFSDEGEAFVHGSGGDGYISTCEILDDYELVGTDTLEQGRKDDSAKPKHSHYHKDVSQYDTIDIYAVCKIFDVQDTSGCLQHAIKKLLVTGRRGHKDRQTDIQNAIDTLNRLLELEGE